MQPNIPEYVLSEPALAVGLTVLVLAVVAWQRTLTYPEYRTAHLIKCYAFLLLDSWARKHGRPLVRTKAAPKDDAEFVRRVEDSPREVFEAMRAHGFEPHLVATAKRRRVNGQHEFAHSQLVYFHVGGQQTEVYLFDADGGTDVYAHTETAVTDPEGHLTEPQQAGDALGAVQAALADRAVHK